MSNKLLDINTLNAIKTYINNGSVHTIMNASSVAGSTTSGSQKSVRWYVSGVDGITNPTNGMKIAIKIPLSGNSSGVALSLNGNVKANYHPVLYNASTLSSQYSEGLIKVLIYDESQSANIYLDSGVSVSVTGCWKCEGDYTIDAPQIKRYI